jgi:hypothetical protein
MQPISWGTPVRRPQRPLRFKRSVSGPLSYWLMVERRRVSVIFLDKFNLISRANQALGRI